MRFNIFNPLYFIQLPGVARPICIRTKQAHNLQVTRTDNHPELVRASEQFRWSHAIATFSVEYSGRGVLHTSTVGDPSLCCPSDPQRQDQQQPIIVSRGRTLRGHQQVIHQHSPLSSSLLLISPLIHQVTKLWTKSWRSAVISESLPPLLTDSVLNATMSGSSIAVGAVL